MAAVQNPAFLISTATVMIGTYGTDVFSLTPALHSVGMVKNTKLGMTSSTIDLTNGIQQNLVDSVKSGVKLTVGFEGYEFSAKNLQLALGISGTPIQYKRGVLTAVAASGGTSLSIGTSPVPGEPGTGLTAIGDIPAGSLLLVQQAAQPDVVFPVMTTGAVTGSGPYSATIAPIPTNMSFAVGDSVWIANQLDVGSTAPLDYFCMKVVGTMSNNNKPVVGIFPKVKITAGFDVNFTETAYGNLPFQVSPFFLTAAEAAVGRLAEIGTNKQARLYVGG